MDLKHDLTIKISSSPFLSPYPTSGCQSYNDTERKGLSGRRIFPGRIPSELELPFQNDTFRRSLGVDVVRLTQDLFLTMSFDESLVLQKSHN